MRVLDNSDAILLFKNAKVLALLEVFMTRPVMLSAAADWVDIPLSSAHRIVERLVKIGILEVVQRVERGGRPIKLYQAAAQSFFIPSMAEVDTLPDELVRDMLEARARKQVPGLMRAVRDALGPASIEWGTVVYADRHGHLVVRHDFKDRRTPKLLDDNTPAYLNFYLDDLHLTPLEAKGLQRELVELLKRYKSAEFGQAAYTLSVVMAPAIRKRQRAL